MRNGSKVLLITVVSFLAFGAWILQSAAQRPAQTPATSDAGTPLKKAHSETTQAHATADASQSVTPAVVQLANFAESAAVRDLPPAPHGVSNSPDGDLEINELNTESGRHSVEGSRSFDGALQSEPRAPTLNTPSTPSLTFEGIAANGFAPPDTNADVGPNDIVETVNILVRVYDKNGVPRGPAFKQSSLFASGGGSAFGASHDKGDPVVLYDRMADRWLISQLGFTSLNSPPYHELVAISKTGDPTGAYYLYDFVLPGNEFPDYPKFGVWPDGYYMTTNQFLNGFSFDGVGAFAFDRKKMLAGDPTATGIYFNLNLASHPEGIFGMLPSDHDGLLSPAVGTPNIFAYFTDDNFGDPHDGLRLFDFHADYVTPANATFTERAESTYANPLLVAAFDARDPPGRGDVEEPSPGENLDSVGERLMYRLQYFNRSGVESLVMNWTVNVSGVNPTNASTYQAGVRYEELRRNTPGGSFSVYDQATFAPGAGNGATGDNRWMGSAAIDNRGNLAVGYSISSTTRIPSIFYAGRDFNVTGGLEVETPMFNGTGVQQATLSRWGDYSSMSLDPADDCSFWYAGEYYSTNGVFNWKTRIGKFKFAGCTPPPQGTLTGVITACDTGAPLQSAEVSVSSGPSNGFSTTTDATGTYSIKLAPGNYTVDVSAVGRSCAPAGPLAATIADGGTTTLNACLSGAAKFIFQSAAVSGGNGNGVIDRNECNNLNVTIKNDGCLLGTNVSAVLSTSTPGVTIAQPASPYPDTPENGASINIVPFRVSTSPSFACPTTISFTLAVTFTGGTSTIPFTLPSCVCPTTTINGSLAAGDLQQTASMRFDNNPSKCGTPKTCPGTSNSGQLLYDIYSFTNQGGVSACVTITLTAGCTSPITSAAYLGSFNPNNICQNYLGDLGNFSLFFTSYSVNVPAGGTLLVNVNEAVLRGLGGCSSYTLTVSGLVCDNPGSLCPPTTIPGSLSGGDLQQTARMSRDGTPSTCSSSKTCPGTLGSGPRLYDIYSFTNSVGVSACVTITLTSGCDPNTNPITSAAYLGSFNPGNLCQNYLGDLGNSPPAQTSYSVNVPANGTLLVNVHEINPGLLGCSSYTLTVSGFLCDGSCAACTITCPPNQTATASASCPTAGVATAVNYPAPTTTGTCGTVTCSPASGSVFPVGTTTVTCSTTAGASCSFTVAVSFCLQDESNPGNVVFVNPQTGDYTFCCGGVTIASGRGTLTTRGCIGSIDNSKGDRQVHIQWDTSANNGLGEGTAYVQKLSNKIVCQITDKNMSNNTCQCSNSPPPGSPRKPPKERTF
jgi:Carboxypeptidase regulatory-like domain